MKKASKTVRKVVKGKAIRQVAAVPYRVRDGKVEILLITSRETRRFIVPKGWPMKGLNSRQAALVEAREEAGITGTTRKAALGRYTYWKRMSSSFIPVEVTTYLLHVEGPSEEWKEAGTRERAWLSPEDAATLIDEPELATLIRSVPKIVLP
jgi:8-oxo-dGTP pyrophosphatase MutT (NUDIX family)